MYRLGYVDGVYVCVICVFAMRPELMVTPLHLHDSTKNEVPQR